MICPNCKHGNPPQKHRCANCNYGMAVMPKPAPTKPRYLGDTGTESHDEELARTFRCSRCRSSGGRVKRIATTGDGFSRLLDYQNHEFIVASCLFCGIVQMFDPEIIDAASSGWPILDVLTDLG